MFTARVESISAPDVKSSVLLLAPATPDISVYFSYYLHQYINNWGIYAPLCQENELPALDESLLYSTDFTLGLQSLKGNSCNSCKKKCSVLLSIEFLIQWIFCITHMSHVTIPRCTCIVHNHTQPSHKNKAN